MRNLLANLAWPMQQSLLMTAVVAEERASAAGIGFAVWGLANAAGPALAGVMIQNGSLEMPLLLGRSRTPPVVWPSCCFRGVRAWASL